jgi:hypothetical protein
MDKNRKAISRVACCNIKAETETWMKNSAIYRMMVSNYRTVLHANEFC